MPMITKPLVELVAARFGLTKEEANGLIMAGRVYADGVPADKPGMPVREQAVLTRKEKARRYASRSGYKLEKALDAFAVPVEGRTACDIGASNGGFTDCLLQHGAAHVYSVDVAYGILAWELRSDERVTVLERTNARYLSRDQLGGTACDIVTADVSFISLTKIFPAIDRVLTPDGVAVCLVKPQFEAQPKQLGKNGVVRDPAILPPLLLSLADSAAEQNLHLCGVTVSPIHGTNGNVEYLMALARTPVLPRDEWDTHIVRALAEQPADTSQHG